MKTKNTESKTLFTALLSLFAVGMVTLILLPEPNAGKSKPIKQTAVKKPVSTAKVNSYASDFESEIAEIPPEATSSLTEPTESFELPKNVKSAEPVIVKLTLSTEVVDREPVDDLDTVDLHSGRFFSHTVVNSSTDSDIQHVYYFDNNEIARVPMNIGTSPSWRCWSSKNIDPNLWKGEWRIDIESNNGTILATKSFNVLETSPPKEQSPLAEQISTLP